MRGGRAASTPRRTRGDETVTVWLNDEVADPCRLARPVNESCKRGNRFQQLSLDPCRLVRPVNKFCERKAARALLTRLLHLPGEPAGAAGCLPRLFLAKKTYSPARQAGWVGSVAAESVGLRVAETIDVDAF